MVKSHFFSHLFYIFYNLSNFRFNFRRNKSCFIFILFRSKCYIYDDKKKHYKFLNMLTSHPPAIIFMMPSSFPAAVKMLYSYMLSALFYGINLLLNEDYYLKIVVLKRRIIWETYIVGIFWLHGFCFVILLYEKSIFPFPYEIYRFKNTFNKFGAY